MTHCMGVVPVSSTKRRAKVRADMLARAARVATVCGSFRLAKIQSSCGANPSEHRIGMGWSMY